MRKGAPILILLLTVASCGTVLEPEDLQGEFVLQATPVILQIHSGHLHILADTLRVNSDGSAERVVAESFQSDDGSHVVMRVEQYRYTIRRGTVEFAFVCPINALMLCTPPPHIWGTPTSTGLSLRLAIDPEAALVYERTRDIGAQHGM
jgi:hypothetical protein